MIGTGLILHSIYVNYSHKYKKGSKKGSNLKRWLFLYTAYTHWNPEIKVSYNKTSAFSVGPPWNFGKKVVIRFVIGTGLLLHSIYVNYSHKSKKGSKKGSNLKRWHRKRTRLIIWYFDFRISVGVSRIQEKSHRKRTRLIIWYFDFRISVGVSRIREKSTFQVRTLFWTLFRFITIVYSF